MFRRVEGCLKYRQLNVSSIGFLPQNCTNGYPGCVCGKNSIISGSNVLKTDEEARKVLSFFLLSTSALNIFSIVC